MPTQTGLLEEIGILKGEQGTNFVTKPSEIAYASSARLVGNAGFYLGGTSTAGFLQKLFF